MRVKNNMVILYYVFFKALLYVILLILRLTLYGKGASYECTMWLV